MAHVMAAEKPQVMDRYIINESTYSLLDMARLLRDDFPQYPLPKSIVPKWIVWIVGPVLSGVSRAFVAKNVGFHLVLDNTRSRQDLGLSYLPMRQTLTEMMTQLIDDGLIRRR
jgi:hypothetical protein